MRKKDGERKRTGAVSMAMWEPLGEGGLFYAVEGEKKLCNGTKSLSKCALLLQLHSFHDSGS